MSTPPLPRIVWLRRRKPGTKVRVVSQIAHDGALVASYHPSCTELIMKVLLP